jgi:uncharacterized lipoprotein YehR (DUF1307 family)
LKKLSIIIICIVVFFASGCNKTEETVKSNTFGFETDKITILRWKDDALQQDNELEKICDIEVKK